MSDGSILNFSIISVPKFLFFHCSKSMFLAEKNITGSRFFFFIFFIFFAHLAVLWFAVFWFAVYLNQSLCSSYLSHSLLDFTKTCAYVYLMHTVQVQQF